MKGRQVEVLELRYISIFLGQRPSNLHSPAHRGPSNLLNE